jgi:hypothetical protein
MSIKLCPIIPNGYQTATSRASLFSTFDLKDLERLEEREQPPLGIPGQSCTTNLFFGFFFDGTKNNYVQAEAGKNHSNVARLYDCYPGLSVKGVLPESTELANIDDEWSN